MLNKAKVKQKILGLTNMEMAIRLGITESKYNSIINKRYIPARKEYRERIYKQIAQILGLKVDELFDEVKIEDTPSPNSYKD